MQVRIYPKHEMELISLASENVRSVVGEANVAIEKHLADARKALKAGSKMPTRRK